MVRQAMVAVSLSLLLMVAGCTINIAPGEAEGEVTDSESASSTQTTTPSDTSVAPVTDQSTVTPAPTEESTGTPDEDSAEPSSSPTSAEEPATEEDTDSTTDEPAESTVSTPEEPIETTKEPSSTTPDQPSETATEEPTETTTDEPTETDDSSSTSDSNFSSEPSPDTTPFPDRPDTLSGETVIGYAIAYEKAYLQNGVANETSASAEGGVVINDIDIKQATILSESAEGFEARLKYELDYTVVNEDGDRRTERTSFTVNYFINETTTKRAAAAGNDQPADPGADDTTRVELPEKPGTLTRDSVASYVAAYEEAHLNNAIVSEDGAGITDINEFDVQNATILNESEEGYGVQLEYVLDYTAVNEDGERRDGTVLVTTDYFVNDTVTKRADPSATGLRTASAAGGEFESGSDPLVDQLLSIAFQYACHSVLGPELGPFASPACSILERWLFG